MANNWQYKVPYAPSWVKRNCPSLSWTAVPQVIVYTPTVPLDPCKTESCDALETTSTDKALIAGHFSFCARTQFEAKYCKKIFLSGNIVPRHLAVIYFPLKAPVSCGGAEVCEIVTASPEAPEQEVSRVLGYIVC